MERYIFIIGTFDTKGEEIRFLRDQILARKQKVRILDAGILKPSPSGVDISNEQVAIAGGRNLEGLSRQRDRGQAVAVMAAGAARIARELFDKEEIQGIVSLGGGSGTVIGTRAMRALPVGLPKVMVFSR